MKHICFFICRISDTGGTERVTSVIANELVKRGFKVSILNKFKPKQLFYELNPTITLAHIYATEKNNRTTIGIIPKVRKYLMKNKVDLIIDVDVTLTTITFLAKLFLSIKHIAWEHFNYLIDNSGWKRKLSRKIAALFADKIIVLTQADLQNYLTYLHAKNMIVIENPVSFTVAQPAKLSAKRVIAVGRLAQQKGFDLLISAFSKVIKIFQDWQLVIFGDGELREELQKQIDDLNLGAHITLGGNVIDVKSEMLKSSLFVLSSRYEGFAIVLIEALSCGLPIISFDCPYGPAEIIKNNVSGYLVENGNISVLAEKIIKIIQDPLLREMLGRNAHLLSHKYRPEHIMEKWETLLTELGITI